MTRTELLDAAKAIVEGDRDEQYGTPENNFDCISWLWNAYLATEDGHRRILNAYDVAAMMILFKVGRISTGGAKNDTWVDIAGYAACGCECSSERDENQLW